MIRRGFLRLSRGAFMLAWLCLQIQGVPAANAQGADDPCRDSTGRFNEVLVLDCTKSMTSELPSNLRKDGARTRWDWARKECLRIIKERENSTCFLQILPFGNRYRNAETGGTDDVGILLAGGGWAGPRGFDLSQPGEAEKARAFVESLKPTEGSTALFFARYRGLQEAIRLSDGGQIPTRLTVLTDSDIAGTTDSNSSYRRAFVTELLPRFDPDNDFDDGGGLVFKGRPGAQNHFEVKSIGVAAEAGLTVAQQPSAIVGPTESRLLPTLTTAGVPFRICVQRAPFSAPFDINGMKSSISLRAQDPRVRIEPPSCPLPPDGGVLSLKAILADNSKGDRLKEGVRVAVDVTIEPVGKIDCLPRRIYLSFAADDFKAGPIEPAGKRRVGATSTFRLSQPPADLQSVRWRILPPGEAAVTRDDRELTLKMHKPGVWRLEALASATRNGATVSDTARLEFECFETTLAVTGPPDGWKGEELRFESSPKAGFLDAEWRAVHPKTGDELAPLRTESAKDRFVAVFRLSQPGEWEIRLRAAHREGVIADAAPVRTKIRDFPSISFASPSQDARIDAGIDFDVRLIVRGVDASGARPRIQLLWIPDGGQPTPMIVPNEGALGAQGGSSVDWQKPVRMPDLPPNVKESAGKLRARLDFGDAAKQALRGLPEPVAEISVRLLPEQFRADRLEPESANPGITGDVSLRKYTSTFRAQFTGQRARDIASFVFSVEQENSSLPPLQTAREDGKAVVGNPPRTEANFQMDVEYAKTPPSGVVVVRSRALDKAGELVAEVTWVCKLSVPPRPRSVELTGDGLQDGTLPVGSKVHASFTPGPEPGERLQVEFSCPEEPEARRPESDDFVFTRTGPHTINGKVIANGAPDPNTPVTPKIVEVVAKVEKPLPTAPPDGKPGEPVKIALDFDGWKGVDRNECTFSATLVQTGRTLRCSRQSGADELIIETSKEDRGDIRVEASVTLPPSINGGLPSPVGYSTTIRCWQAPIGPVEPDIPASFTVSKGSSAIPALSRCLHSTRNLGFWRLAGSSQAAPPALTELTPLLEALRSESEAERAIDAEMSARGYHRIGANGAIEVAPWNDPQPPSETSASLPPGQKSAAIEISFIGLAPGTTANDPPQAALLNTTTNIRAPIDWSLLALLLGATVLATWLLARLLRGNDPLLWQFAADVEFAAKDEHERMRASSLPSRSNEHFPWPFLVKLGSGRLAHDLSPLPPDLAQHPKAGECNPMYFEPDLVARPWWKGPLFSLSRKKTDVPLSTLLQGIWFIEGLRRPQVLSELMGVAERLKGITLRIEPSPSSRITVFDPMFSTFGGNLLDVEPGEGLQNPETPIKTFHLVLQQGPQVKLHVMVRLAEGLHRDMTTGLLNIIPLLFPVLAIVVIVWQVFL